ncbi:hypothetical protein VNO77_29660 [Canavalia gladiata]|uniref:Uridine kinase n=1 Tax=Canavalia gladiata TaxID=3824 RepID=A0AAN9KPN0_CANGL
MHAILKDQFKPALYLLFQTCLSRLMFRPTYWKIRLFSFFFRTQFIVDQVRFPISIFLLIYDLSGSGFLSSKLIPFITVLSFPQWLRLSSSLPFCVGFVGTSFYLLVSTEIQPRSLVPGIVALYHMMLSSCCDVRRIGWKRHIMMMMMSLPMGTKSAVDLTESSSEVHFSGFYTDGLEQRKAGTEQPTTSATDMYKQPFVIGVAGGAASGKTAVCDMIIQQLHDQRVVLVNQDSFYHNLTEEELTRVQDYNFDHPEAFDTERLLRVMDKLKRGQAADIPKYDFKGYKSDVFPARRVNPADVIILEGILVFHDPRVRALMNMKIFVDTDADVRLARRIKRDTAENARDIGAVLDQYSKFVKPAFDDFILPTKKYADIIIPRGGDNHVAIDLIVQHIRTKLGQHDLCKIYPNLYVIQSTFQIRGMHTLIRDSQTTKHDYVFYSDRLIRLVVEHGLGHLPFTEKQIITPTGSVYSGVDFCKRLCGVSIIRSGESMENALRACCKGIKIGKILIHREGDNGQQLIYEKLPNDISDRHVLLLDPILGTGNSAVQAISLLLRKGVPESNIIFLNLISAPQGVHVVCKSFPRIKIVTSEIDIGLNEDFRVVPGMGEFGDRYFGTDDDDQLVVAPSQ